MRNSQSSLFEERSSTFEIRNSKFFLWRSQAVRHRIVNPVIEGSNPSATARLTSVSSFEPVVFLTRNSGLETDFSLAVAEGFEPSIAGLTIRCLTNLATPQKRLAAATRVELAQPRLQDECSVIQLSYAAIWWTGRDSNPHEKFAGLLCCHYITSPNLVAVGGVEPPT